jgi:hypothetical protein
MQIATDFAALKQLKVEKQFGRWSWSFAVWFFGLMMRTSQLPDKHTMWYEHTHIFYQPNLSWLSWHSNFHVMYTPCGPSKIGDKTHRKCSRNRCYENKVKTVHRILHSYSQLDRYTHWLTPVSSTCIANFPELHSLCHWTITAYCAKENTEGSPNARKVRIPIDWCS